MNRDLLALDIGPQHLPGYAYARVQSLYRLARWCDDEGPFDGITWRSDACRAAAVLTGDDYGADWERALLDLQSELSDGRRDRDWHDATQEFYERLNFALNHTEEEEPMATTKTKAKRDRRTARRRTKLTVECWLDRTIAENEHGPIPLLICRCPQCGAEHQQRRVKTCECGFYFPLPREMSRIDEQSTGRPTVHRGGSWVCPDCGHPSNHVSEKHCENCNWDGTEIFAAMFQEGLQRKADGKVPETQAEAASKEAAAGGIETIKLSFTKAARCAAWIDLAPGNDGAWCDRISGETDWKRGRDVGWTEGLCVHYEPAPRSREEALEKALDRLAEKFVGVLDKNLSQAGIKARQAAVVELANERERLLTIPERPDDGVEMYEEWKARFFASVPAAAPGLDAPEWDVEERLSELYHDRMTVQEALACFEHSTPARSGRKGTGRKGSDVARAARKGAKTQRKQPVAPTAAQDTVRDVPLRLIDENPINARRDFSQVDTIAASMRQHGQLQECLGRQRGERVELIAGNCRYRAAKKAKLATLRVRIIDVDDLTALDVMGEENAKRGEWSAIEKAAWYQAELDARGMSHRELAKHLGVSAGDIANHVRLLKFPESWQEKVISGEITATMARTLAPWAERPGVLEAVDKIVREKRTYGDPITADDFEWDVKEAVHEATLPLTGGDYFQEVIDGKKVSGHVRITPSVLKKHREALDVVEVDSYRGKQLVCFNRELWWQLQQEAQAAYDKKQKAGGSKGKSAQGQAVKAELTPAEKKQRREQQARQLRTRVWKYKVGWYQQRMVEQIEECDAFQRVWLLLYFAGQHERDGLQAAVAAGLKSVGKRAPSGSYGRMNLYAGLRQTGDAQSAGLQCEFLRRCLTLDPFSFQTPLHAKDVPAIAEDLGVCLRDDWLCERPFLELFTKDQLGGLVKEWKLKPPNGDWPEKRGDLITHVLEAALAGKAKPPKILLKAKG